MSDFNPNGTPFKTRAEIAKFLQGEGWLQQNIKLLFREQTLIPNTFTRGQIAFLTTMAGADCLAPTYAIPIKEVDASA